MANEEQLAIVRQGVEAWNAWRAEHALMKPDLQNADLHGANLHGAHLHGAHLRQTNLSAADLIKADLHGADLQGADLYGAHLRQTNLSAADLSGADLRWANLRGADLLWANLSGADLQYSTLVETNFTHARLSDCHVYGISAWGLQLEGATQTNLSISAPGEPTITVDDLELAQFLYLMLHNNKIRRIIDTLTSKVVLILGRFTPERKAVLDALREELRTRNYVPVLFDFEGPSSKDIVETVTLLARMARFVLADLTDAAMVRTELSLTVPDLPSVPVQPLIQGTAAELPEIQHLKRFPWMLPTHSYADLHALLADLPGRVIAPAEAKAGELGSAR